MVSRRLRAKNLVGKTVTIWYRAAFDKQYFDSTGDKFFGEGIQGTLAYSNNGLTIYHLAWKLFSRIWQGESIRMVGIAVSNVKNMQPENLSLFSEVERDRVVTSVLDKVNDRFGEFTLQRGFLVGSYKMKRMPNPFLSDRRFKL